MISNSYAATFHAGLTTEQLLRGERYLIKTREALVESTAGLCVSQWNFKPVSGGWSIADNVEHLALIEERVHGLIERIGDAPEPAAGWEQEQVDEFILREVPKRSTKVMAPIAATPANRWSGEEALRQFEKAREQTVRLLVAPCLRGHVWPHPILGPWDGYQWLLATAAHSARHTAQILEVKACSGYPG